MRLTGWFSALLSGRWSRTFNAPPSKVTADQGQHPFRIFEYSFVLKAQQPDAVRFNKKAFGTIAQFWTFYIVAFAVQLDREPFGRTIEIENVIPNAMLTAELSAVQPSILYHVPKCCLRRSETASICTTEALEFWELVDIGWTSFWRHCS